MENKDESIFPTSESNYHNQNYQSIGLTKREFFAGLAFQAYLSSDGVGNAGMIEAEVAKSAVRYADALITELNKK